jgi:ATP-binding cassette subfamily D (ALD) long-chain fatty acid import protein
MYARADVLVVPQRAYMVAGTLLDQCVRRPRRASWCSADARRRIIYPHTHADFVRAGRTEAELAQILEHVFLAYLPAREGGWRAVREWRDVLSGGEKQRMGLARVFYHAPRFAVLDGAGV